MHAVEQHVRATRHRGGRRGGLEIGPSTRRRRKRPIRPGPPRPPSPRPTPTARPQPAAAHGPTLARKRRARCPTLGRPRRRRNSTGKASKPPDAPPGPLPRDENGELSLLQSRAGIDADESYGSQEYALSSYLKLHPVLSLESTSYQTLQLVANLVEATSIPPRSSRSCPSRTTTRTSGANCPARTHRTASVPGGHATRILPLDSRVRRPPNT